MTKTIKSTAMILCLIWMNLNTTELFANGGGGGAIGGRNQTGPAYDPVEKYQEGVLHLQNKEYKKAEKAFKKVLKVVKKDANSHFLLGVSYVGQEKFKKARRPLEKALRYDDELVSARGHLGAVYHKLGEPEKAEQQKQWLLEKLHACGDCDQKEPLSTAIRRVEQAVEAETQPEVMLDWRPDNDVSDATNYLLAVELINQGKYRSALTHLRISALNIGPHPDILTYQGFANRKLRQFDLANRYYRSALRVDRRHRGANEYLGEYFVELGNLRAAYRQLSKLERICSFGCEEAEELRRWIAAAES